MTTNFTGGIVTGDWNVLTKTKVFRVNVHNNPQGGNNTQILKFIQPANTILTDFEFIITKRVRRTASSGSQTIRIEFDGNNITESLNFNNRDYLPAWINRRTVKDNDSSSVNHWTDVDREVTVTIINRPLSHEGNGMLIVKLLDLR